MKITSGNLFSFGLEDSGQHEAKLRKAAYALSLESYTEPVFKTVSIGDPQVKKLIDESEHDKYLGDVVRQRGTQSLTGFYLDSQLVGFAVPRKDSDGRYRTGAIYVTPSHQGKGIASKFTRTYFKGKSGRAMIESDNTKSQHLFESIGFKRSGKTIKDSEGTSYEIWLLN